MSVSYGLKRSSAKVIFRKPPLQLVCTVECDKCSIGSSALPPAPRRSKGNPSLSKKRKLRRVNNCSTGTRESLKEELTISYLPEAATDPVNEARVLILKDEAGRKDKVFLYDSQGDEQTFHNGRYSPVPKRVVVPLCWLVQLIIRRIEI